MTRPVRGSGDRRTTATATATDDARDLAEALAWVQAARAVAVERFPYLDSALTAMLPVARPGLGTVATDARWRFYYDPERVLALTSGGGVDPVVSDWVHEVGHLLRDHPARWTELSEPPQQQPLYNVAGDALINDDLAQLGLTILPTDVTFRRLPQAAGVRRDMTTEEIYRRLRDLPDRARPTGAPRDCGSGAGGERRPWEEPVDDPAADSAGGMLGAAAGEIADGSVDAGRADSIREETAIKVRARVRQQGASSVPAGLRDWSDQVLDPVVDWRRELRSAVTRALAPAAGRRDYAWGRPSRRRVPGYAFPGMVAPAPPEVAVVVDTSGSMSSDDLAQCMADVAGIVRAGAHPGTAPTPVRVIPCDTSVGDVQAVRHRADLARIRLTGGGGTNMGAGIRAAVGLRPQPHVVVVLTDGETPWPAHPPEAAHGCRFIAVVIQAGCRAPDPPDWIRTIVAPGPSA